MANPVDAFHQQLVDSVADAERRHELYKTQYNENHAYRLANAYMQYPWVNPQITVSLVLNDADEMLPKIAELAARRMLERTGLTPFDLSRKENIAQMRQSAHLSALEAEDTDGSEALSLYAKSWGD